MTNNTNTNAMTIYAEALSANRELKNARIDGKTVGVKEARAWNTAVNAMLIPAYAVFKYHHDTLGNQVDDSLILEALMNKVYNALHPVLDLVGEVNGAKLFADTCAPLVCSVAARIVTVDLTVEMANARWYKKQANYVLENGMDGLVLVSMDEERAKFIKDLTEAAKSEETLEVFVEECNEAVKRLESEPGNCRKEYAINTDSAFKNAVEIALGDAINGQRMKSVEDVMAEVEARRQARRAKTAAKKANKKSAK